MRGKNWRQFCDVFVSENIRIRPSTRIRNVIGLKNFHSGERIKKFPDLLAVCVRTIAVSRKIKLRIQKYQDTCGRGLNLAIQLKQYRHQREKRNSQNLHCVNHICHTRAIFNECHNTFTFSKTVISNNGFQAPVFSTSPKIVILNFPVTFFSLRKSYRKTVIARRSY